MSKRNVQQKQWDPDRVLATLGFAKQYIEELMQQAQRLHGMRSGRFLVTNYFFVVDALLVVEMGLKGIISCDGGGTVDKTHSTKYLYSKIECVSQKAIESRWHGESFREYMNFLDGAFEKWRYAFVEVNAETPSIDFIDLFQAINVLHDVLMVRMQEKYKCECGSMMIRVGAVSICDNCKRRRPEYDAGAREHRVRRF